MTGQRDLAESVAHERRRLVRACFSVGPYAEGLDARRVARRVAGGVLLALMLVVALVVRASLGGDVAASPQGSPPRLAAGLSPSPAP